MSFLSPNTPDHSVPATKYDFERRIIQLKRRLVREATIAIAMLEASAKALLTLDVEAARAVRREDDQVDSEEVAIEQESFEILALKHVFARDFRALTFVIKVNADIERVADHASSIAKITGKIAKLLPPGRVPHWPTALVELTQRVPMICHAVMKTVLDEDEEAAKRFIATDETIDQLDRTLFDEAIEFVKEEGKSDSAIALGIYIARLGREWERVGDLMCNIAEDLIYLKTGQIIRHEEKRNRFRATGS